MSTVAPGEMRSTMFSSTVRPSAETEAMVFVNPPTVIVKRLVAARSVNAISSSYVRMIFVPEVFTCFD